MTASRRCSLLAQSTSAAREGLTLREPIADENQSLRPPARLSDSSPPDAPTPGLPLCSRLVQSTKSQLRLLLQVKVDPLVECDGVTVATRLPIAGEAGLDQQPLALVVVVGRNLGRQCGTRAHDAHPFCQDEKTLKAPICWIIGLICSFLYCQWHCGQRIAPANRGNRFAHNKKRPTTIRRVGSSSKTASLP